MYGSLDVSVSGMVAQRTRLAVISSNIAHADTVLDAQGNINPYKRREIMFAPGDPSAKNPHARALGVHVKAIEANPDAHRPLPADGELILVGTDDAQVRFTDEFGVVRRRVRRPHTPSSTPPAD